MAGGKETPRQKMIGMMYLVLTALLALNVSKTILDAFVAIEENIQIANINEQIRGTEKYNLIKEKAGESQKAKAVMNIVHDIDKKTAENIQLIDKVKLLVLMEIKEEVTMGEEKSIIIKDRPGISLNLDLKNPGLKNNPEPGIPIRMNLHHVQGKDKYDEGMRVLGISSPNDINKPDPKGLGIEIWESMFKFRKELCDFICVASTQLDKIDSVNKVYSYKDPNIRAYKTKGDLVKQVFTGMKNVKGDDSTAIKEIYISLTKNEQVMDEVTEAMAHWIGKTFDHAPSVAVLASLSSLQKEILTARAQTITHLQSKIGGGEYSFNKVMALAYPEQGVVNGGEQFNMSVLMAAFDTERQPDVRPSQGTVISTKNGTGIVKLQAPQSGEMKITGSISIKNKNGLTKTENYEAIVQVVPPMGTVTLPEFSIMYRGYANKVTAVAGGSKGETTISVAGGSNTKSAFTVNGQKFNGWVVKPTGNQVTVTVNGKDSQGATKSFGKFTYRVKPFPKPQVITSKISKSAGARLIVSLGPDCPIGGVTFNIKGGEVQSGDGVPFGGAVIPGSAVSKMKNGKRVGVTVSVTNSVTGVTELISGTLTVGP